MPIALTSVAGSATRPSLPSRNQPASPRLMITIIGQSSHRLNRPPMRALDPRRRATPAREEQRANVLGQSRTEHQRRRWSCGWSAIARDFRKC